jgi:hypothetical protein
MLKRTMFSSLITGALSAALLIILFPLDFNGMNTERSHMQNIYTSMIVYPAFILGCLIMYVAPLSMMLEYCSRKFPLLSNLWMRLLFYTILALPIYLYFRELGAIIFSLITAIIFWVVTEIYGRPKYSIIHPYLDKIAVGSLVLMVVAATLAMGMTG